jgi:hypothetical protein
MYGSYPFARPPRGGSLGADEAHVQAVLTSWRKHRRRRFWLRLRATIFGRRKVWQPTDEPAACAANCQV